MSACYTGPDPYDNERGRMAIWGWAKKASGVDPVTGRETGGGINEGRSFDDVHDAINRHFYNGLARPEWITEKLAGRKTPLKPFAMASKLAEMNRRNIVAHAQDLTNTIQKQQKQRPIGRALETAFDFPRKLAVGGHSLALTQTHPGDLVFQPRNMGAYWSNLLHTWGKAFPLVSAKRSAEMNVEVNDYFNNKVKKTANYDMALASKLDIGEGAHGGNLIGQAGTPTARAWKLIQVARYKMFSSEYNLALKRNPALSEGDKLELGKLLAQMANHATGSSGGMPKEVSPALFGPRLTASKISRLIGDPIQTLRHSPWSPIFDPTSSPAQRVVANRRMVRATQYLTTLGVFLGANWGFNKATGTKDEDNVNLTDPTRADFLSFKTGGLEWSVPGMHTELKFLANVIAISAQQFWSQKEINKKSRGQGQWGELQKSAGQWALNKLVPGGQIAGELLLGHNWQGRPLPEPWVDQTGTKNALPYGAFPQLKGPFHYADAGLEYALEHAPIPFTGPIRYIYDQLRDRGSSAGDALSIIRSLGQGAALTAGGIAGFHANPTFKSATEAKKQNFVANQLGH
jgi:hypothetical protein